VVVNQVDVGSCRVAVTAPSAFLRLAAAVRSVPGRRRAPFPVHSCHRSAADAGSAACARVERQRAKSPLGVSQVGRAPRSSYSDVFVAEASMDFSFFSTSLLLSLQIPRSAHGSGRWLMNIA